MQAARLYRGEKRLRIEDVPVPEPQGDQVLVRVAGAGVCHSDLHTLDGAFDDFMSFPMTIGHEIAGHVEAMGPETTNLDVGEAVTVVVGWGCGHCEWCVSGHEQICPQGDEAGATQDGGFAEYVLVPHRRHVIPLGSLDLGQATPFGCAALCSYQCRTPQMTASAPSPPTSTIPTARPSASSRSSRVIRPAAQSYFGQSGGVKDEREAF